MLLKLGLGSWNSISLLALGWGGGIWSSALGALLRGWSDWSVTILTVLAVLDIRNIGLVAVERHLLLNSLSGWLLGGRLASSLGDWVALGVDLWGSGLAWGLWNWVAVSIELWCGWLAWSSLLLWSGWDWVGLNLM